MQNEIRQKEVAKLAIKNVHFFENLFWKFLLGLLASLLVESSPIRAETLQLNIFASAKICFVLGQISAFSHFEMVWRETDSSSASCSCEKFASWRCFRKLFPNSILFPAYIIVREAVKESICVRQKKKRAAHFTQISPRRPLS